MNLLKKSWVIYNSVVLIVLVTLYSLEYGYIFLYDYGFSHDKSGLGDLRGIFVVSAFWIFAFNTLLFVPIWLIVLAFKRKLLTAKAFWIGFGLFVLSFVPGVSSIVGIIGFTAG